MKHRKVLALKQLPTRPPVSYTIAICLFLDRMNAAPWLWGATVTILVIVWVATIVAMWTQDEVEIEELKS